MHAFAGLGELPLVRTTLNAWRERLPNDCDAISCWNDLFVWYVEYYINLMSSCLLRHPPHTALSFNRQMHEAEEILLV